MEKKNYIVAIDLGSSNVVVVVGSKDAYGKLSIDDVAVREVEGVVRGEIKNIEQVAKSIKEAVEEVESRLGIKISEVYTGISGQHIKCAKDSYYVYIGRDGEIRDDDVQKLKDNMRNVQAPDGKCILDFIPQNYIVNDEEVNDPVGMFGQKLEATFNFIIGDASNIARMEKALTKVDLKQIQLFINPLVSAEAVVLPDEKELGVAVLDIGAGTTDICIYHDKIARHIGVVPLGADMINKDIRSYGILERYIEDLKVKYGSAVSQGASTDKLIKVPGRTPREPKEISFYNLAMIIEARIMDILDYAMEEIKLAGYEGRLGAGLVLTGGCAQTNDIEALVKAHTGMDVRVANPDIHVCEASRDMVADARLSTAIGLLLKGMQTGKATRVETVRKIQTPMQPQEPVHQPVRPVVQRPVTAKTPSDDRQDDSFVEDDQTPERVRKEKKNPFKKFLKSITDQFEVIDDNEI